MKKRHVKEVDFPGRSTPEPVKGNIERPWGQARGHSCQMRPERNMWLLSKESVSEEGLRPQAELRWPRNSEW